MTDNTIDIGEEKGVRYLHFGSEWVQGAMRIARPWNLELEYTREMMACLLLRPEDWPRKVLVVGLGAGSLAKFLFRHRPQSHITAIEIDERVVLAAHLHFSVPRDERLDIVIDDAARYIQNTSEEFDLILVDGFDANARAGELATSPFYAACREQLAPQGLMAVNLFGRTRGFKASFFNIAETFEGNAIVFPSSDAGNAIALACKEGPILIDIEEWTESAKKLKTTTGLNLLPLMSRIQAELLR